MTTASVFANDISPYIDRCALHAAATSEVQNDNTWPVIDRPTTAATEAESENQSRWLVSAYKSLASFRSLRQNWDTYGAEAPNASAIRLARAVVHILGKNDFLPQSIDPSAEGGVCISFRRGPKYGDIECFNTGEILAALTSDFDETYVWSVEETESGIEDAVRKIVAYVESNRCR